MFPRRPTLYTAQGGARAPPVAVIAVHPIPRVPNVQPTPPPSPPPSPPPQGNGGGGVPVGNPAAQGILRDFTDFQLIFAHEILTEKFTSNNVVRKIFKWMYRNRPGATDKLTESEYVDIQKTIEQNLQYKRTIFCGSCSHVIPNMNGRCSAAGCGRYRQRKNRMRVNKMTILDSVDLRSYVEDVVTRNIEDVLRSHMEIHQNRDPLGDCRFSPAVREHVETRQQFMNGQLIIPLVLYTDAFTFKGVQRGSSWPVILSFISLPPEMRQQLTNMLVPFLISSGIDPSMAIWKLITVKILRFLRVVQRRPLIIRAANGRRMQVKFTLPFHSMDLKAVCQLFRMTGWAGYWGCPRCLLRGQQHGSRGMKWPTGQFSASRTLSRVIPGGVYYDSARRINGFRGSSPFLQLFSPSMLLPDPLHCIAEGILKDIYKGAVDGGSRPGLVLTAGGRATMQLLSSSAYVSLNSRVILVGSMDFNSATGSEREAIYCTVFCTCLMNIDNILSPYASSLALFLGLFVRFVQCHKLNHVKVQQMQHLLMQFFDTHRVLYGHHFDTMKFHQLEHLIQLLPRFGSPYGCSTSSGEAANRLLKLDAPPLSTRNFHTQSFKKCIIKQSLLREIKMRSAGGSLECETYIENKRTTSIDRAMSHRVFAANGCFYSPGDRRIPQQMNALEHQAYVILRAAAAAHSTYL